MNLQLRTHCFLKKRAPFCACWGQSSRWRGCFLIELQCLSSAWDPVKPVAEDFRRLSLLRTLKCGRLCRNSYTPRDIFNVQLQIHCFLIKCAAFCMHRSQSSRWRPVSGWTAARGRWPRMCGTRGRVCEASRWFLWRLRRRSLRGPWMARCSIGALSPARGGSGSPRRMGGSRTPRAPPTQVSHLESTMG